MRRLEFIFADDASRKGSKVGTGSLSRGRCGQGTSLAVTVSLGRLRKR